MEENLLNDNDLEYDLPDINPPAEEMLQETCQNHSKDKKTFV